MDTIKTIVAIISFLTILKTVYKKCCEMKQRERLTDHIKSLSEKRLIESIEHAQKKKDFDEYIKCVYGKVSFVEMPQQESTIWVLQ